MTQQKNTLQKQNDEMEISKIQLKYLKNEIDNIKVVNQENKKLQEELKNFQQQHQQGELQCNEIKKNQLLIRQQLDLLEIQKIEIDHQLKLSQMSEETLKNLTQEVESKKQQIKELEQKKLKIQELIKEKNDLDDQIKLQQFKDKPQNPQFQFPQNQFNQQNQQSLNKSFSTSFQSVNLDPQTFNQNTKQQFPFKDFQKPK